MISVYLLLDLCLSPCPTSPATETGVGVARACGAAPLGDG